MAKSDTGLSSPDSDRPCAHDADIADLYGSGVSTSEIAHRLGMRGAEVIGRIRALKLKPPNMIQPVSSAPVEATVRDAAREIARAQSPPREPTDADPRSVTPAATGGERRPTADRETVNGGTSQGPRSRKAAEPRAVPSAEPDEDADDDEEDGFNAALRRLPGRPRGWLITEREFTEMSERLGGRFEDARFRTSTKTS